MWNENIDYERFESGWHSLMSEYALFEHSWFQTLFQLQAYWVPAYLTDVFMGGLVRTNRSPKGRTILLDTSPNRSRP